MYAGAVARPQLLLQRVGHHGRGRGDGGEAGRSTDATGICIAGVAGGQTVAQSATVQGHALDYVGQRVERDVLLLLLLQQLRRLHGQSDVQAASIDAAAVANGAGCGAGDAAVVAAAAGRDGLGQRCSTRTGHSGRGNAAALMHAAAGAKASLGSVRRM